MPGATPALALPYPLPDDTVDVPRDVKALADKLDTAAVSEVTALPGSPVNGQVIALTLAGGRFILSRVAGAWRCEGGAPALASRLGGGTIAGGGAVVAPSDGGLSLALVPGVWDVSWEFTTFRPVSSPGGSALTAQPQGAGLPVLLNAGSGNPEALVVFPGTGLSASFGEFMHHGMTQRFTLSGDGVINERYTGLNVTWTVQSRILQPMPVSL